MSQLPSSRTLAKAIVVFGGAQAFKVLAALVRSKVAALTIGAAGVGLNALYTTLSNFVSNLMGCGLASSSIPSLCKLEGDEQREVIARLRLLGILLSIAAIPVTLVVAMFYGTEALWLAFAVVALVETGIESAVLKSLKATRQLSFSLFAAALLSVVCTVPFFLWLGRDGIIWAVVCTSVTSALVTCWLGYRVCPVLPSFGLLHGDLFRQSKPMFVLGLAFLFSGLISQGTDLLVQNWFNAKASLAIVGLYKAGYQLSITYTGMMFAAVVNDFYPRLASVSSDVSLRNQLVSRQMRVQFCIALPIILLFIALVPWIIPLLLSDEFLPIVPMVRIAALSMILKAIYLPIAYLPVAQGRSWHFLLIECISWGMMAVGVMLGYTLAGLTGVGVGLLVANLFDLCFNWLFCRIKYSFRLCFDK